MICSVYWDPDRDSLAKRAQVGVIIGRSDETKGYRVNIQNDNKVTVSQHVPNIKHLAQKKSQLQRALEYEDQATTSASGAAVATPSPVPIANVASTNESSEWTVRVDKKKSKS